MGAVTTYSARPLGGDRLFALIRVEVSGDRIAFTPLDRLPVEYLLGPLGFDFHVHGRNSRWPRELYSVKDVRKVLDSSGDEQPYHYDTSRVNGPISGRGNRTQG